MFKTLVVSGGSTKGLAIVGALLYIQSKVDLNCIDFYFCTSAGSIICSLLAIGFTPLELVSAFERLPIRVRPRLDKTNPSFFDYNVIVEYITNLFIQKVGRTLTLKEMRDIYGKELNIITYNYSKDCVQTLSWRTHPNMDCVQSVRLSSAMAFLFEQCEYKGDVYVDGAFGNNFPLDLACENGYTEILGINLSSLPKRSLNDNAFKKMSELFFIPMVAYTSRVIKQYQSKCILIDIVCELPPYELELDIHMILKLLSIGYKAGMDQYKPPILKHISTFPRNPNTTAPQHSLDLSLIHI
jgi:predicted acylesterase/phospholipase RssA